MTAKGGGSGAAKNWQELPQQVWQSLLDAAQPVLAEANPADMIQRILAMAAAGGGDATHAVESRLAAGGEQFLQWAQSLVKGLSGGAASASGGAPAEALGSLLQQSMGSLSSQAEPLLKLMQQGIDMAARPLAGIWPGVDPMAGSRSEMEACLHLPNFGFAREHQERRQKLAAAALAFQEAMGRYQQLLGKSSQDGLERLRNKLAEREQPGRQIESLRGLYDLWIDAAEEAYADVALSSEFRSVYGDLVNKQMVLRQCVQTEVEHASSAVGMPTRTELNAVHARLHAMRRELRGLQQQVANQTADKSVTAAEPSTEQPPRKQRTPKQQATSPIRRKADRKTKGKLAAGAVAQVKTKAKAKAKTKAKAKAKAKAKVRTKVRTKAKKPVETRNSPKPAVSRRLLNRFA